MAALRIFTHTALFFEQCQVQDDKSKSHTSFFPELLFSFNPRTSLWDGVTTPTEFSPNQRAHLKGSLIPFAISSHEASSPPTTLSHMQSSLCLNTSH